MRPRRGLPALRSSVPQASEAVEADGASERVAGFPLVQFRARLSAQGWIVQPVQGEEGALDRLTSRSAKASPFWRG